MLGFTRKDADTALVKVIKENSGASVETVIKLTLKRL
jgi:Holliday junction resolvasome RuvABC DNA-binding subunit